MDVALMFLVLAVCLYTFLPKSWRAEYDRLSGIAWQAICAVFQWAWRLFVRAMYGVFGLEKDFTHSTRAAHTPPLRYDNTPAPATPEPPNERTNERRSNRERTAVEERALALQLDRTKTAVIHTLVAAGWNVSEIRSVLKGTADDLGKEIAAVKELHAAGRTSPPADDPNAWQPGERAGTLVRVK